jgi:hypothetical protein
MNQTVDVTGDTATGFSRGTWVVTDPEKKLRISIIANYYDQFVREGGRWKFKRHQIGGTGAVDVHPVRSRPRPVREHHRQKPHGDASESTRRPSSQPQTRSRNRGHTTTDSMKKLSIILTRLRVGAIHIPRIVRIRQARWEQPTQYF